MTSSKQTDGQDLLFELCCLTNRVLSSRGCNVLSVLFEHVRGWPEVALAAIAELIVVEERGLRNG